MFYIRLLSIVGLVLLANALPISIINKRGLIIARDVDDSISLAENTALAFDSTPLSDFSTDDSANRVSLENISDPTLDDKSSSDDFTVALTPIAPHGGQKLYCPYDNDVDGYAVYFVQFWSKASNMKDWHQAILLKEIGKNHEFLYDVTGDLDQGPLERRKRDPFFISMYPFTETRLLGIITPKAKLVQFEAIVNSIPPPACRDDGNCQTWVSKVIDAAIPNPISPLSLQNPA